MADWTAFGAVAGLVLFLVLALARVTTAALTSDGEGARPPGDVPSERSGGVLRSTDGDSRSSLEARRSSETPRRSEDEPWRPTDEPWRSGDDSSGTPDDATSSTNDASTSTDDASVPSDHTPSSVDQDPAAADQEPHATDQEPHATDSEPDSVDASAGTAGGSAREPPSDADAHAGGRSGVVDGGVAADSSDVAARTIDGRPVRRADDEPPALPSISGWALLGNVIVTHGVLAAVIAGAAAMTGVPAWSLGIEDAAWSTGAPAVAGGLALGLALAFANGVAAANLDRLGIDHSDALRTSLAPESAAGWVLLLAVTLPLVSLFEELLFRSVLVGAATAATGVSPWAFVVLSSFAFAAGHGLQGRGGVLVTGLLGGVLAVAFVLTNSLLLVVVAHYVVNAAEFLLHEWLGVDVQSRLAV